MIKTLLHWPFVALFALVTLPSDSPAHGAAAETRREIDALYARVREAGDLYSQKKYDESAEVVREVQRRVEELSEQPDEAILSMLEPVYRRIVRAHALLELEQIELPPLKRLRRRVEPGSSPEDAARVSFVKQIAPLIIGKCGRCHVDDDQGSLRMDTYASLLRGSDAGAVVFAGNAGGSRLVQLIEIKDMPRGGLKVTAEELAMLKRWIDEGARFDGEDPKTPLATSSGESSPEPPPTASAPSMSSTDTADGFARGVAPLLVEHCSGCHVDANRPRGGLNLTTYAAAMKGGDSGPAIDPGRGAQSLLVRKLRGTADGQRMPQGRSPLPDDAIARIERWITEGAAFDGPDPGQDIRQVAALAEAESSTHEQLSEARARRATRNWSLGLPNVTADRCETEHFLLLGNVGSATLQEYGQQAEAIVPRVAQLLRAAKGEPLIKGRMTLYVFQQRYDYSEFGQMVEGRNPSREQRGHWRYTVIDAYGALLPPRDESYEFKGLVAQLTAGVYLAGLNNAPRWFAEGSARVIAARVSSQDERIAQWDRELPRVLSSLTKPDDFLAGRIPQEDADVASYGFLKFLTKDARRHNRLLQLLREGEGFGPAFQTVYGGDPAMLAQAWAAQAAKNRRRTR